MQELVINVGVRSCCGLPATECSCNSWQPLSSPYSLPSWEPIENCGGKGGTKGPCPGLKAGKQVSSLLPARKAVGKGKKPSAKESKAEKRIAESKKLLEEGMAILKQMEGFADTEPEKPLTATGIKTNQKMQEAAKTAIGLTPSQQKEYSEAARRVCGRIPEEGHRRLEENLQKVSFHPDSASVTDKVWKGVEAKVDFGSKGELGEKFRQLEEKKFKLRNQAAGSYNRENREVNLDGAAPLAEAGFGKAGGLITAHVYAHELGHAIDGPKGELSSSKEWSQVQTSEIQANRAGRPSLTAYARTSSREGFAEFCRLVYGGGVDLGRVETDFPQATSFMKERKLWPN